MKKAHHIYCDITGAAKSWCGKPFDPDETYLQTIEEAIQHRMWPQIPYRKVVCHECILAVVSKITNKAPDRKAE